MKKVLILINHFQLQDGVARSAINLANELATREDLQVTLQALFRFDKQLCRTLSPAVKAKPFLGFYFRGLARLVDLIPDRFLNKLLVNDHYDVQIGYCMTLPIQIIAAGTKSGVVRYGWIHGYDTGLTLRCSYEKMDKVIAVSQSNALRFAEETAGTIPVCCCHNLPDDQRICELGNEAINLPTDNTTTFVAVGRLEPGKGILRLIECCGRLKQAGYLFRLWIIGDGPQRPELETKAKELSLEEQILFLGAQQNPYTYMSKADVLVCPSYSEGYSTVCAEAILLNVPVLTTDVGGAREIIEDAKAGMMVGQDDQALYDGLQQILEHPETVEQWKRTLRTTKHTFSRKNRALEVWEALNL